MARLRSKSGSYDQGIIASSSAPSAAFVGQIWFNSATGVTYQWTTDGASNFWLDISSGGIGTSASRGVDFVGDTDPHLETSTTGAGLAVGSVYYNRETDRYFVCTNSGTNSNAWAGRYAGIGGAETTFKSSGGDFFRVHTFLNSGTFYMENTTTCDILVVAGGGAGGTGSGSGGGGGGGIVYTANKSTVAGDYTIVVGNGGAPAYDIEQGLNGENSSISGLSIAAAVGGGGGGSEGSGNTNGQVGGSGGGAHTSGSPGAGTSGQGNAGGTSGSHQWMGTGGGGANAAGGAQNATTGGVGGAGQSYATTYGTVGGAAGVFSGGGGGSAQVSNNVGGLGGAGGGGAGGAYQGNNIAFATAGIANTGGGGGGDKCCNNTSPGGAGGSGIVIVRYQLNA